MSFNRITLLGRVGKDPETKSAQNGTAICKFSVATSKKYNGKEETAWHNIVCFGKTAENCGKYLTKGREVLIEGEISYNEYQDKNGVKKTSTEIIAQSVHFVGGKPQGARQEAPAAPPSRVGDVSIPF